MKCDADGSNEFLMQSPKTKLSISHSEEKVSLQNIFETSTKMHGMHSSFDEFFSECGTSLFPQLTVLLIYSTNVQTLSKNNGVNKH